jgi:hypothetical protein
MEAAPLRQTQKNAVTPVPLHAACGASGRNCLSHRAFLLDKKENQECIEMILRGADRLFVQDDLLLDY